MQLIFVQSTDFVQSTIFVFASSRVGCSRWNWPTIEAQGKQLIELSLQRRRQCATMAGYIGGQLEIPEAVFVCEQGQSRTRGDEIIAEPSRSSNVKE